MAEMNPENAEVNARIVYWGVEGAGKSANLRSIFDKLRPDHRGELCSVPTGLDPSVTYDSLPIELGDVAGTCTRIQIVGVPGAPEQAPTRKALLDRVDGVVFVVDSQSERVEDNLAAFEELRQALASYGRSLSELPLVVQYNKRDLADPYALEELHRKLDLRGIAAFEGVASEGVGVLQTLTTISKRVIRVLRDHGDELASPIPEPSSIEEPAESPAETADLLTDPGSADPMDEWEADELPLETALTQEEDHPDAEAIELTVTQTEALLDPSFGELEAEKDAVVGLPGIDARFSVAEVGRATQVGRRSVRVPLILEEASGSRVEVALTVSLDFPDDESKA